MCVCAAGGKKRKAGGKHFKLDGSDLKAHQKVGQSATGNS